MAIRAILHILGEESILCDIDEMPKPADNFVVVYNPRRRDGKPLPTMDDNVSSVVFPWTKVSYIELFEDRAQRENLVGFFRETDSRHRST